MSVTNLSLVEATLDELIIRLESINPRIPIPEIDLRHCYLADKDHKKSKRVYAHVGCEKDTICVSRALGRDLDKGELHIGNVQGVLLHEIGHTLEDHYGKHLIHPNTEDPEILADYAIWFLYKLKIWYDRNKVQWIDLD